MIVPAHLADLPLFGNPNEAMAVGGDGRHVAIRHREHGEGVVELHVVNQNYSRTDGPAVTVYRADGTVSETRWYLDGNKHRVGGLPAWVNHDVTGAPLDSGEWCFHGKSHRIGGPAVYWPGVSVAWWVRGAYFSTRAAAFTAIAEGGEAMIRDALLGTEFAELLDADVDLEAAFAAVRAGVRTVSGVHEVLGGSPAEWVAAFDSGQTLGWVAA